MDIHLCTSKYLTYSSIKEEKRKKIDEIGKLVLTSVIKGVHLTQLWVNNLPFASLGYTEMRGIENEGGEKENPHLQPNRNFSC